MQHAKCRMQAGKATECEMQIANAKCERGSAFGLLRLAFRQGLFVSAVVMTALCVDMRLASAATVCENLAMLSLPNTTVTLAQPVAAGSFAPPAPSARAGGG